MQKSSPGHRLTLICYSSARGNTSLESAVSLTKSLRWDIQNLGQRLAKAAGEEERLQKSVQKADAKSKKQLELKQIVNEISKVLERIEDAVPLINLAITTSGASLSTSLPSTISPSRLLQSSTFLTAGDTQYTSFQSHSVQIGPTFTLSLYMLFQGHIRPLNEEQIRETTWQEVIHKARLKLIRLPLESLYDPPDATNNTPAWSSEARQDAEQDFLIEARSDEYAYQVIIVEDLNDDRVHTYEEGDIHPTPCHGVDQAGIREAVPVHEISKIFYADTGKILNIGSDGEMNNPILLLKRDPSAVPPRRMMQRFNEFEDQIIESIEQVSTPPVKVPAEDVAESRLPATSADRFASEQQAPSSTAEEDVAATEWRIPSNIDPEWLAFEVYTESEDSDTESDTAETPASRPANSRAQSLDPNLTQALSNLQINGRSSPGLNPSNSQQLVRTSSKHSSPTVKTSLSLLETLLRLLSLQQFQQTSHLSIPDELLNFFLSEAATTGAATGDDVSRRRMRNEARQRVGFDPYDESPIKRRGEDYQYRGGTSQAGGDWDENNGQWNSDGWDQERAAFTSPHDEGYGTYQFSDPQHPGDIMPQSTPLLLKNRPRFSRSSTPERGLPPLPGGPGRDNARSPSLSSSPKTPPSMQTRFRSFQQASRRGSPLARPSSEPADDRGKSTPQKNEAGED